MGESYIENLREIGKIHKYYDKNIIFFEGEIPQKLMILLKGKVRLYKIANDAEKTLHMLFAPCFIAEMPSLSQKAYPASAICDGKCEILEVNLAKLRENALKNNAFCMDLIASLCEKIGILERHITQNAKSLREKLIAFLLENHANLPSQRKIAEILNTNPQSISRILKSLKQNGAIAVNKGKIVVLDSQKLAEMIWS